MPESKGPAPSSSLEGRVAVVTGAASGLGLATAKTLSEHGARVVLIDRKPANAAEFDAGAQVSSHIADIADGAEMERIFERIAREIGAVSILINSAGVPTPGSVVQRGQPMKLSEFRQVIEINLLGTINAIRCAVPQMINRRPELAPDEEAGVIINVASIAAYDGQIGSAAYSASKGGVAGMVLPLARELGDYGIRVLGIAPGIFETPMTTNLPEKHRDILLSSVPPFPRRPGQPNEFAMLALSMIANPMLNGEVIRLDGGLRLPARV